MCACSLTVIGPEHNLLEAGYVTDETDTSNMQFLVMLSSVSIVAGHSDLVSTP